MKRKKKMWMFLAAALLCLGMSSSVWAVTETLETDVTEAGDGCELFGVRGSYLAEESERIDTLTELNRIRKEACVNGVELNGEKLTASDYVELKWSRDLENIARIRAAEAYVQTAFWDTDIRLNGKKFSTLTMNGVTSDEELRLWTWAESIYAGVYNWYTLKSDEYYTLIDPQYHYVGMGLFHRDNGTYSGTIAVEFSTSESLKEGTPGLSVEDCIQNVEVKTDYLSGEYAIEGTSTGKVGDVCALDFTTSISSVSMQIPLIVYQPTSWLSSDTSVASMSGAGYTGYLSVKGCGTATIKAIAGGNTAKLTFNASHSETQKVTPATTAQDGSIQTVCSACGTVISSKTISYPKTIKLSGTSYTYDGKVKKPSVTVTDAAGNAISSDYYTLTYTSGRKNVGKYMVTVTFKGNYTGTKKLTFTIKPMGTSISKITAGKKKLTVKWKKQTKQTTGYQIQASLKKSFASPKTVTVTKAKTTSKVIQSLKAKKKYYVRIRTYKSVNGTKYYSSWSKAKTAKTK